MGKKTLYTAGDMLNRGAQLQRAEEAEALRALGFDVHNPLEDKSINDKKVVDQTNLAERIVKNDTAGILASDIMVSEPLFHAVGTQIEMGQAHGLKLMGQMILDIMDDCKSPDEMYERIEKLCLKQVNRKHYVHYQDIRRFPGVTESEDRRSLGIHQYMLGIALDLTEGRGIQEWDEILKELKENE